MNKQEADTENTTEMEQNNPEIEIVDAAKNVDEVDELGLVKTELEESRNKYIYLAAEMENSRRRFDKEKENLLKYGNEKLLKGMLDVVDNFERTIDAIGTDEDDKVKNIVVGIEMVKKQLVDSLKTFGLEEVKALGEVFDPNFHEALGQEISEDAREDEVLKEYQKGYILNGRLLRATKVIIAKK